jgi:hypothetical protein
MTDDRDDLDAERLEEDWKRALDAADEAVNSTGRTRTLGSSDADAASEHIREQRSWLRSFRPTLRRMFPGRRGRSDG